MNKAEVFFNSRTFAVVGASRDQEKVGHILFRNLLESTKHTGINVFPVNPNAKEILGKRCYSNLLEIPYNIDCLIIALPSKVVPEILMQAYSKKVKCALVISAGFSEAGNSLLEQNIVEIAKKTGIELLGPNILGMIDAVKEINMSFFKGMPKKGAISLLSQSGALGTGILDIAIKNQIGFSSFVSLGNMAMLDFSDFIEYLETDKNTEVICLYMESLKEEKGKRFIEVCKRVSKKKPIIALKSGKTKSGIKAAFSHTASLASDEKVYSGIFKQAGVIEVESMREMFQLADLIIKIKKRENNLRNIRNRALVVTNAGGLGVLAADSLSENRIELVPLPDKVKERLSSFLPEGWSKNNPIDLLGDALAERYMAVLNLLDKESFFDFFIVLLTPQHMTQPLETAKYLTHLKKPVMTCFFGGNAVAESMNLLTYKDIPVFSEISDLGNCLGKLQGRY